MDNASISPPQGDPRGDSAFDVQAAQSVAPATDLRLLFRKLWYFRNRILLAVAVCALIGAFYASGLPPSYTASARLLMGNFAASTDQDELEQTATLDNQRLATAVEIFYSTRILRGVATELLENNGVRLTVNNGVLSLRRTDQRYSVTGQGNAAATVADTNTGGVKNTAHDISLAVELLRDNLTVQRVSESSVISVSYKSGDPVFSMQAVNLAADHYVESLRQARSESTDRQLAWLNQRIDELRGEIQKAEDTVEAKRAELSLEEGQGLDIIQQVLSARTDELAAVQSEVAQLELLSARLTAALADERSILTIAEFREAPLIREIMATVRELEDRIRTLSESSSARADLEEQVQNKMADIRREAERIDISVRQDLEAARGRERLLTDGVRQLETRALKMTRSQLELHQLEMDAEIRRSNYGDLNRQLLNTIGRAELRPIGVQVLSRAELPELPDADRPIIIILSAFTGLLLASGSIVLGDVFTDRVRAVGELRSIAGQRVFGRIPKMRGRRPRQILSHFLQNPQSALSEAVRSLAVNILHASSDGKQRMILFTSPVGNEGKSTLALMTAIQLQRMGQKTLFLDCEPTSAAFHTLFDDGASRGSVKSVLNSGTAWRQAISVDSATGLSLLTLQDESGPGDSLTDSFHSEGFHSLMAELRREFQNVIINVQPTLIASDAKSLASLSDMILMVVRWNYTKRNALFDSITELESVGVRPTGLILNVVHEHKAIPYEPGGYEYYRSRARRPLGISRGFLGRAKTLRKSGSATPRKPPQAAQDDPAAS